MPSRPTAGREARRCRLIVIFARHYLPVSMLNGRTRRQSRNQTNGLYLHHYIRYFIFDDGRDYTSLSLPEPH